MSSSRVVAILEGLPLPAILVAPNERIETLNGPARRLFDPSATGRHYITLLRQPDVLDAVEQTFRDGRTRTCRYLGAESARDTTWRVSVAAVEADGGRSVLLSFEDVTAVEEASQIRRDFVANVSHELRTPLTALLGFVETLRGPAREDAAARDRFLDIMEREAARMARLVADLLSLSRVEEEERLRPMAPVDIAAVARTVAATFEPQAARSRITMRLDLPPDGAVHVPGDQGQLRQVLNNLVENAIKYGGAGKEIRIALSEPALEPSLRTEGVRLVVADQGEGIAAHHIPRLTERFYRVDSHRSREVGGTGLGLAIVKHIVNRHRGRLRVASEPGQGTTFTIVLPLS